MLLVTYWKHFWKWGEGQACRFSPWRAEHCSYQRIWKAQMDNYSHSPLKWLQDHQTCCCYRSSVLTATLSSPQRKNGLYIWSYLVSVGDLLHSTMLHLPGDWCSLHGNLGKLKHTRFNSCLVWTITEQEGMEHHDLLKLKVISNLYAFLSLWTYLCYHVFKQHGSFLTSVHLISIN